MLLAVPAESVTATSSSTGAYFPKLPSIFTPTAHIGIQLKLQYVLYVTSFYVHSLQMYIVLKEIHRVLITMICDALWDMYYSDTIMTIFPQYLFTPLPHKIVSF